jgi:hypothetical protein
VSPVKYELEFFIPEDAILHLFKFFTDFSSSLLVIYESRTWSGSYIRVFHKFNLFHFYPNIISTVIV